MARAVCGCHASAVGVASQTAPGNYTAAASPRRGNVRNRRRAPRFPAWQPDFSELSAGFRAIVET